MSVGRAALVAVLALSGCECRPAPGPTTPPTTLPEFGPGTKPATGPKLVVCDELTSDTAWYPLALNKAGMRPWALQTAGAPDVMILDKSSALYETQRKVGVDAMMEAAGSLLLPHCLHKYAGA